MVMFSKSPKTGTFFEFKTGKLVKEKISDQWPLKTNGTACKLTFDTLPPFL